jgi:hypothetical protein
VAIFAGEREYSLFSNDSPVIARVYFITHFAKKIIRSTFISRLSANLDADWLALLAAKGATDAKNCVVNCIYACVPYLKQ